MCLKGPHGSGKTFLLRRIIQAADARGVDVVGFDEVAGIAQSKRVGVGALAMDGVAVVVDDAQYLHTAKGAATSLKNLVAPLVSANRRKGKPSRKNKGPAPFECRPRLVIVCVHDTYTLPSSLMWLKGMPAQSLRAAQPMEMVAFAKRAKLPLPRSMDQLEVMVHSCDGDLNKLQLLIQMRDRTNDANGGGTFRHFAKALCGHHTPPDMFHDATEVMQGKRTATAPNEFRRSGVLSLLHANSIAAFGDSIEDFSAAADRFSDADVLDDRVFGCAGLQPRIRSVSWAPRLKTKELEAKNAAQHALLPKMRSFAFELLRDVPEVDFALQTQESSGVSYLAWHVFERLSTMSMADKREVMERAKVDAQWLRSFAAMLEPFDVRSAKQRTKEAASTTSTRKRAPPRARKRRPPSGPVAKRLDQALESAANVGGDATT